MSFTRFLFLCFFVIALHEAATAQLFYNRVGTLDTTLNGTGYVGIGGGGSLYPTRVKQLSDRSIIIVGQENNSVSIVKLTASGTLDTAFGSGGRSLIACASCLMRDIVELADGKLILAGETNFFAPQQPTDLLLARLNSNGSLDTTFATNGFAQHDLPVGMGQFSDEHMGEISVLPDGSIIAAAVTSVSSDHVNKSCSGLIIKFLANGNLDTSFGLGGFSRLVIGDEPASNAMCFANLSVFENGRIAVAFSAREKAVKEPSGYLEKGIAAKYLADGEPDPVFSAVIVDRDWFLDAAAVGENGLLLLTNTALRKVGADGTADNDFASNGTFAFPIGSFPGFISIQASGKVYVTGHKLAFSNLGTWMNSGEVLRLWPNGQRDLRFGRSGSASVKIENQELFLGPAFIESDGKIALTGTQPPNRVFYIRLKAQR